MSTFSDRDSSALIVIDVQRDVVADACHRGETIGNIQDLVTRAREAGSPVISVQHSDGEMERGSPGWEIVPELTPAAGEPLVHKVYGDSFEATDLEELVGAAGVGRLLLCGAQSDACIRLTAHGAFTRGYDVTLVSDAHTTSDMTEWGAPAPEVAISHINLYWQFQAAPERTANVVSTRDVAFEASGT